METSVALTEPRRKKPRRGCKVELKQPFPVPIASLTGLTADNETWRWYDGQLVSSTSGQVVVEVNDPDAIRMISTMGYFGEVVRKEESPGRRFVKIESFDPVLTLDKDDTFTASSLASSASGECADMNPDATSSESEAEEATKNKWAKWKAAADFYKGETTEDEFKLVLDSHEAFFLTFGLGCLLVHDLDSDKILNVDALWQKFTLADSDFRQNYAVYHHFRSKGWVVKDGTKFGNDYLLYKDGPPFYHASYSVRVTSASRGLTWTQMSALNRVTESAAKELLLAEVSVAGPEKQEGAEDLSAKEYLERVIVNEILIKRWVPAQKRENESNQ